MPDPDPDPDPDASTPSSRNPVVESSAAESHSAVYHAGGGGAGGRPQHVKRSYDPTMLKNCEKSVMLKLDRPGRAMCDAGSRDTGDDEDWVAAENAPENSREIERPRSHRESEEEPVPYTSRVTSITSKERPIRSTVSHGSVRARSEPELGPGPGPRVHGHRTHTRETPEEKTAPQGNVYTRLSPPSPPSAGFHPGGQVGSG